MDPSLLEVRQLKKYFNRTAKFIGESSPALKAVDGISFTISKGEILGLVGESGCGKSTAARTILRLYEPTAGKVFYDGQDIYTLSKTQMQRYRRKMQIILQDPAAALNPRMNVNDMIGEPLDIHHLADGNARSARVNTLLDAVGLPKDFLRRYPHELSGGQRQRVGIARALAVEPEFLILDEPVSSLDVAVQAQVVSMLEELQQTIGLTYLFITHNMAIVRYLCNRVAVMCSGKIVELAQTERLFDHALHPYTNALLSATRLSSPVQREKGDAAEPRSGCIYHPRCTATIPLCREEAPPLREITPHHQIACHLPWGQA